MPRQLVVYNGQLFPSDSANSPTSAVERDAAGQSNFSIVNAISKLIAGGGLFLGTATLATTGTLDQTATVWKLNAAGGAFTATLPPAAGSANQFYWVLKSDSSGNLPTIKGNGAELIGLANTYTALTAQGNGVLLWCDGTQWWVK